MANYIPMKQGAYDAYGNPIGRPQLPPTRGDAPPLPINTYPTTVPIPANSSAAPQPETGVAPLLNRDERRQMKELYPDETPPRAPTPLEKFFQFLTGSRDAGAADLSSYDPRAIVPTAGLAYPPGYESIGGELVPMPPNLRPSPVDIRPQLANIRPDLSPQLNAYRVPQVSAPTPAPTPDLSPYDPRAIVPTAGLAYPPGYESIGGESVPMPPNLRPSPVDIRPQPINIRPNLSPQLNTYQVPRVSTPTPAPTPDLSPYDPRAIVPTAGLAYPPGYESIGGELVSMPPNLRPSPVDIRPQPINIRPNLSPQLNTYRVPQVSAPTPAPTPGLSPYDPRAIVPTAGLDTVPPATFNAPTVFPQVATPAPTPGLSPYDPRAIVPTAGLDTVPPATFNAPTVFPQVATPAPTPGLSPYDPRAIVPTAGLDTVPPATFNAPTVFPQVSAPTLQSTPIQKGSGVLSSTFPSQTKGFDPRLGYDPSINIGDLVAQQGSKDTYLAQQAALAGEPIPEPLGTPPPITEQLRAAGSDIASAARSTVDTIGRGTTYAIKASNPGTNTVPPESGISLPNSGIGLPNNRITSLTSTYPANIPSGVQTPQDVIGINVGGTTYYRNDSQGVPILSNTPQGATVQGFNSSPAYAMGATLAAQRPDIYNPDGTPRQVTFGGQAVDPGLAQAVATSAQMTKEMQALNPRGGEPRIAGGESAYDAAVRHIRNSGLSAGTQLDYIKNLDAQRTQTAISAANNAATVAHAQMQQDTEAARIGSAERIEASRAAVQNRRSDAMLGGKSKVTMEDIPILYKTAPDIRAPGGTIHTATQGSFGGIGATPQAAANDLRNNIHLAIDTKFNELYGNPEARVQLESAYNTTDKAKLQEQYRADIYPQITRRQRTSQPMQQIGTGDYGEYQ